MSEEHESPKRLNMLWFVFFFWGWFALFYTLGRMVGWWLPMVLSFSLVSLYLLQRWVEREEEEERWLAEVCPNVLSGGSYGDFRRVGVSKDACTEWARKTKLSHDPSR